METVLYPLKQITFRLVLAFTFVFAFFFFIYLVTKILNSHPMVPIVILLVTSFAGVAGFMTVRRNIGEPEEIEALHAYATKLRPFAMMATGGAILCAAMYVFILQSVAGLTVSMIAAFIAWKIDREVFKWSIERKLYSAKPKQFLNSKYHVLFLSGMSAHVLMTFFVLFLTIWR